MRLPQKKKPGDPVMAEDWNLLLDAITARTPRSGNGLKLICSSGGFAYSSPPQMVTHISHPPFSVIGIEKAGTAYKVTMKEGWVIERQPKTVLHPAVGFWMPKAGTVKLDATPRPQVTMAIGNTAWCRIKTNNQGLITEDPTISVSGANHDGSHYFPEDPDASGQDGDYYVKLFKLEDDAGTPRVRVYQQSDIEHWAQLWTGRNVGTGSRVFKEHTEEENIYKFRSIKAGSGITVTENADDIEVETSGWWGDVTISFTGTTGYTEYVTLRIENGGIQHVFVRTGEVSGDETTPGLATLSTVDTDT
jgi:hypothetical protein